MNDEILEIEENEEQVESEPSTEEVTEELEEIEELEGTVSGGDSTDIEDMSQIEAGITSDLIEVVLSAEQNELFEKNNELLTQLVEVQTQTIMNKPLAQYTPTEGMLLILVVFALGVVLGSIIRGILPCRQ